MPSTIAAAIIGIASVIDGDTIEIHGQRIRLWGIDAPESSQQCLVDERAWRCGTASANALDEFISGRAVSCEVVDTDRYRRSVSRCHVDGVSLNAWAVQNGYAVEYAHFSRGAYAAEESLARARRAGVWASQFQMPWDYRRANQSN